MDTFFAWPTIDQSGFRKEVSFRYGNPAIPGDFSDWNSIHEDLDVTVNIAPRTDIPGLSGFVSSGETAAVVIRWTGDGKFSGCSPLQPCGFPDPVTLQCRIPKGACALSLSIECNIIVQPLPGTTVSGWGRPPGSIIATIPIQDKPIGKGDMFPVSEYEGDGMHLIHWDFSEGMDLDMPPASGVRVLLDKKHPFMRNNPKSEENTWIISLMIIQGFARKAFAPMIFDQLEEKETQGLTWKPDSLGGSFDSVFKKLCAGLHVDSYGGLKKMYRSHPEKIDQCIDEIFAEPLKKKPELL